jgi:transcriptional regulator of arginine metabolism
VTQATISRDIRELSLTKIVGENGKQKYAAVSYKDTAPPVFSDRYARVLQDGMVSVEQADNLVVIKTVSGMAMAVAAAIDALGLDQIVGSIAGDDTIMCAVRTAELVPEVIRQLTGES